MRNFGPQGTFNDLVFGGIFGHNWVVYVLQTSRGQGPGLLLNVPHCTGQPYNGELSDPTRQ